MKMDKNTAVNMCLMGIGKINKDLLALALYTRGIKLESIDMEEMDNIARYMVNSSFEDKIKGRTRQPFPSKVYKKYIGVEEMCKRMYDSNNDMGRVMIELGIVVNYTNYEAYRKIKTEIRKDSVRKKLKQLLQKEINSGNIYAMTSDHKLSSSMSKFNVFINKALEKIVGLKPPYHYRDNIWDDELYKDLYDMTKLNTMSTRKQNSILNKRLKAKGVK